MYERFTDRARKVMQLANQEAQRFHHEYIGTEHILLGLVKEGSGHAANALKNLDIDLRKLRLEVENIVQFGPDMVTMGKLRQTPRSKKVIEYAVEEARNHSHHYVGTEHLLLGLLREQEGMAAQVLMNLGLNLNRVRQETLELLVSPPAPPAPERKPVVRCQLPWPLPGGLTDVYPALTSRARKVVQLANQEAHRLNHDHVGTEHILLGLVKESCGIASHALRERGLNLCKLREAVEQSLPLGTGVLTHGALPLTPRAKSSLVAALEEANQRGEARIGPEHLLLALIADADGMAAQVVMSLGVSLDDLRKHVIRIMSCDRLLQPEIDAPRAEATGVSSNGRNPLRDLVRRLEIELQGQFNVLGLFLSCWLFGFGACMTLVGSIIGFLCRGNSQLTDAALAGGVAVLLTAVLFRPDDSGRSPAS